MCSWYIQVQLGHGVALGKNIYPQYSVLADCNLTVRAVWQEYKSN